MMRDLREKTKWVMLAVALAFVGLMVFEWGMDISGTSSAQQTGELGRVNGETVSYQAYSAAYQQLTEQARLRNGNVQLTREQISELEDQAFNQVVNEILMRQELRRRGLSASDREIVQAAQWMPHPELMQNELFLTDGEFDIGKYQQFLNSPAANEDLLMQLEAYYRSTIPQSKLVRQITAGLYIGDAELWRIWRDQSETATADYVPLSLSALAPGEVTISDREIRDYYERNAARFERTATGRFNLAYISKLPTAADTAAAVQKAERLRAEIAAGADFATVAARESDDQGSRSRGGDLGAFRRNQMVPDFEAAAFSLPVGQLSQPVRTDYGVHLIEVTDRQDEEVTARHILVSYDPSDEALDALYTRADSLEIIAERNGVDRAAGVVGATLRSNVVLSMDDSYLPGVGSALEAVEWARDEQAEADPLDVSPVFETPEALYIVQLEAYSGPGRIPLAEATPEIRRLLTLEKKTADARRIGQEMVAEVRGGRSLEEVARARGLTMESTGPITRIGFNPAFGQANAATGAAFGTAIGQVSDVVETPGGLFIVRPTERTEADRAEFEQQKHQLRQIALMQLQQESIARWMDDLRKQANIIDRRSTVLQRS